MSQHLIRLPVADAAVAHLAVGLPGIAAGELRRSGLHGKDGVGKLPEDQRLIGLVMDIGPEMGVGAADDHMDGGTPAGFKGLL